MREAGGAGSPRTQEEAGEWGRLRGTARRTWGVWPPKPVALHGPPLRIALRTAPTPASPSVPECRREAVGAWEDAVSPGAPESAVNTAQRQLGPLLRPGFRCHQYYSREETHDPPFCQRKRLQGEPDFSSWPGVLRSKGAPQGLNGSLTRAPELHTLASPAAAWELLPTGWAFLVGALRGS